MATQRKGWLPREGFHLSVLTTLFKQTLLNPTLTLPLYLLAHYSNYGRGVALDHPKALKNLKLLLYLGAFRYINGLLDRGAQNNWTSAKPDWSKELVVVTGGSDGMGRLLVGKLAERGVKVVILDIENPVGGLSSKVHYIRCDISSLEDIQSAATKIRSEHGDPSVILLNAGVFNQYSILNTPDHLLRRVFDVNTLSHYRLMREFLPAMVKANHGLICTTASLASFVTCPGMVDYAGTKAAAVSFHEGLTAELVTRYNAPKVRTLCVCPNFVYTKLAAGHVNHATFVNPTLHPETVVEAQFDRIWRWEGGIFGLPSAQEGFAMKLRGWPSWMQNKVRNDLGNVTRGIEQAEQERVKTLKDLDDRMMQGLRASQSMVEVQQGEGEGAQPEMFG